MVEFSKSFRMKEKSKLENLHRQLQESIEQANRGELLDAEEVFSELLAKNARRPRKL